MSSKHEEQLKNAENTALTATAGYNELANVDIASLLTEEFDGLSVDFERIKIPSGGSTMFELPGEDSDEPETVKEFSGVILYHHTVYAYYQSEYAGGNNPPDCSSFDGKTGTGVPGGKCQTCPYNQFGSGKNNAKACKNRRRIYILREGEIFPLLLSLPTGSLKMFTQYLKRLVSKGRHANSVVTRFSLKKAINTTGVAYSQAQFAIDRVLTPDEYVHINKWTEQIKEISGKVALDNDEQDSGMAANINVDPNTGELIAPLTGDSVITDGDIPF